VPLYRDPATGALFGVTEQGGHANNGVVYELVPPATSDVAASGTIYGATLLGGDNLNGVLFALGPPTWTETVLHKLDLTDGSGPWGRIVFGPDGAVYGTTFGAGPGATGQSIATCHETGIAIKKAPAMAGALRRNRPVRRRRDPAPFRCRASPGRRPPTG
jgi:hypothetical protein